MKLSALGLGIVVVGWGLTTRALDLYTGSVGTTPDAQGWLLYGSDPLNPLLLSQTSGGKTTLDTLSAPSTGNLPHAGFSNYAGFPTHLVNGAFTALDRVIGFDVRIENLKLNSEQHSTADRAGFSIIAISSAPDHKGIEIGFHLGEVFAQKDSPLFTGQGETGAVDLTQPHNFDLIVTSGGYALWMDGASSPVLSGALRDYSAFDPTPLPVNPYTLPSYLFFGDDTTSAGASAEFSRISVSAVPEPAALTLGAVAAGLMTLRRRARR